MKVSSDIICKQVLLYFIEILCPTERVIVSYGLFLWIIWIIMDYSLALYLTQYRLGILYIYTQTGSVITETSYLETSI